MSALKRTLAATGIVIFAYTCFPVRVSAHAADKEKTRPLEIEVDASEAPRRIIHSRLVIPARPARAKSVGDSAAMKGFFGVFTKQTRTAPGAVLVEVRFTENSNLKLTLHDETVEFTTRFGKLIIPVADIRQAEFATRIPDEIARRASNALADLGSTQFRQREAAAAELRALKEKAYPTLLQGVKHSDPEVYAASRNY